MNREDGQVYSDCILQFSCFTNCTTVCSQNINKQNVIIADETYTDYSFLSSYHYTKSKNYLKRRYWIRHWMPMFIGTPCLCQLSVGWLVSLGSNEPRSGWTNHAKKFWDSVDHHFSLCFHVICVSMLFESLVEIKIWNLKSSSFYWYMQRRL